MVVSVSVSVSVGLGFGVVGCCAMPCLVVWLILFLVLLWRSWGFAPAVKPSSRVWDELRVTYP